MKNKKKIKVCFLGGELDTKAGWGRLAKEIIDGVSKNGVNTEVINLGNDLSIGFLKMFRLALKIRKNLKKCDIIHCFDAFPWGVVGALANIGLNKKMVINGVGTWSVLPLYQKKNARLVSWAYKKADKVLSISRFTADEIQKKIKLNNIEVITLGVDLEKFKLCPPKSDADGRKKIILSVGALKFRKGYHVSIPAVAEVKKHYPEIKYRIVGDQSGLKYFNELKRLARKNGLEDNVEFLSSLSDKELRDLYCECDLFLLLSVNEGHSFEGFGLTHLEANACGRPAIGTLGCGSEDAIKNGYSGFLVPQNDIKAASEAILKILGDSKLAGELGQNSYLWAKANTWEKTAKKYVDIYEKLIK